MSRSYEKFLAALDAGQTVNNAANAAGVSRTRVYQWREKDQDFAEAWDRIAASFRRRPDPVSPPNGEDISKQLKAWVGKHDLYDSEAAKILGISMNTYYRWLRGEPAHNSTLIKFRLKYPPETT